MSRGLLQPKPSSRFSERNHFRLFLSIACASVPRMTALELAKLLNPAQYEAATTTEGPLLILAGAGSGKTRVLVHRIAHIVESGLAAPYQIFAVTFTNKAAGEMRERLSKLLGESVKQAWIGTFHALAARILRLEGHRLGYTASFTIYDDDDSKRLLKTIGEEMKIDTSSDGVTLASIANEIDRAKNRGLSPKQYADAVGAEDYAPAKGAARKIYPRYQDALRRSNAMDFGDLMVLCVELLTHHPEARERFARRFRYVLVDEFQDTNNVQYDLLKQLVGGHQNLAVVGDDDQSIYRWRGADVANILGFSKHFPEAKVIKLEQNYRSSANILEAANSVIKKNTRRHEKTLFTESKAGNAVGVAIVGRSEDEAQLVAQMISRRIQAGERPENFAILYRQNAQSRLFEESLRRYRVPYVLIGGTGFYDRMEVKDILAYLRVTANPTSRQDFERIVSVPKRGIGETTLEALRAAVEPLGFEGAMMLEAPEAVLRASIKPAAWTKLAGLRHLLRELRKIAETESAESVAKAVIARIEYLAYLQKNDPTSAEDRAANVAELVSSIAEHEASLAAEAELDDGFGIAGAKTPLAAFLDTAALVSTNDQKSEEGAVSMLTLHSAKGLEFPVVFMVGMEEQTFPSKRAVEGGPAELEEERRLCYVGITRAMKELNLIASRMRRIYGYEEARWPSRFLGDIPDGVVGPVGNAQVPKTSVREPTSLTTPRAARTVSRGSDEIVYDSDGLPPVGSDDYEDQAEFDVFRRGSRVLHDRFGEGIVDMVEGRGPMARLSIRFEEAGIRRVVARFVRSLD